MLAERRRRRVDPRPACANLNAATGTLNAPSMPLPRSWRWMTPRLVSCGSAIASPMRAHPRRRHMARLQKLLPFVGGARRMISSSTAISRAWSASRSSLVRLIMSGRSSTVHKRRCWRRLLAPSITTPALVSNAPLVGMRMAVAVRLGMHAVAQITSHVRAHQDHRHVEHRHVDALPAPGLLALE